MTIRVFIVDDHAGYRLQARKLLTMGGFEVVGEAADAANCLSLCAAAGPDVVLVDVGLPDATGFDVARQLRARPGAPAIVLVSSRDWSDCVRRTQACGAAGFLDKEQVSAARIRELLCASS